jgi:hypothetical protein
VVCAISLQNQPVDNRRTRRRSLLLSVLLQIAILAALVLIPMLSKTPRIALANVMPVPPYCHATTADHATPRQARIPALTNFRFASHARPY